MKSREQKRTEAIERAKEAFVYMRKENRGWTLEKYLDIFRKKEDKQS